jgi:hypothetical protein
VIEYVEEDVWKKNMTRNVRVEMTVMKINIFARYPEEAALIRSGRL